MHLKFRSAAGAYRAKRESPSVDGTHVLSLANERCILSSRSNSPRRVTSADSTLFLGLGCIVVCPPASYVIVNNS